MTKLTTLGRIVKELDGAYEPRSILRMIYYPKIIWGSNSVGQSSVLIKRRSRVQVPPAPPESGELTDDDLEHVIGGASPQAFNHWRANIINGQNK